MTPVLGRVRTIRYHHPWWWTHGAAGLSIGVTWSRVYELRPSHAEF